MTKSKSKIKRHIRTKRIYYGPEGHETSMWWTVRITDAKAPITINGTAAAALRAHRGVTVGCALSRTAMDSAKEFGHPVYLASVTKSTLLAVDQLHKDGSPAHAVMYGHSYGNIVDGNDTGELKKIVKQNPEVMERPFYLRPPKRHPKQHGGNDRGNPTSRTNDRRAYVPKGALARAVRAGRIGKHVAQQLADVAQAKSKEDTGQRVA